MFHDHIEDDQFYRNKTSLKLVIALASIFLLLIGRLFYLQIIEYDYHFRLSEENRVRLKVIQAPRGLIYDRNYRILAKNRPSFQISLLPNEIVDKEKVFKKIIGITDTLGYPVFDSAKVAYMFERGKWKKFTALSLYEDASLDLVSVIEEHQLDLQGIISVLEGRRDYPYGTIAAHAIGYTAKINEDEIEEYKKKGYQLESRIGVEGLEKAYEEEFRGEDGKIFVEVNAFGKEVGVIEDMPNRPALPGHNLISTLDMDLQKAAEEAFPDSVKGALVALDPRTGEVFAILSSPQIDGNIFSLSREKRSGEWQRIAMDSNRPLNNRAIIGLYEPASTFKAIVSLASFRSGKVTPEYSGFTYCTGGYKFGNLFKRCWHRGGHGRVNFYDAFRQSCDVYYYQVGLMIDMDIINETASFFGLGSKTGIDLPGEYSGLLMDSTIYNKRFASLGWRWTRGQVLNLAIGQGQLATPIQLASMAAGLGNGKVIYVPHMMKKIESKDGQLITDNTPEVLSEVHLSSNEHKWILEAMRQVVEAPGGTGGRAAVPGVVVGGKTGSAENPHGDQTHALFIAVAPLYKPEIAIAVVLENAGHGGSVAAPIAGKVLNAYFYPGQHGRPEEN